MEAGTVVYWNHTTYAKICVHCLAWGHSRRAIEFQLVINGKGCEASIRELEMDGDVVLYIWCSDEGYNLGYRPCAEQNEKAIKWVGETIVDEITADPLIGAAFTGMMLGLYATGNGDSGMVPAVFEFAEFDTLHKPDPIIIQPLACCG